VLTDSVIPFQKGSPLFEEVWKDYEYRPQQEKMARAVREALDDERIALIEAGTGVGKTLAYLIPLLHYAVTTGKRVVVSTETRSLQKQIIEKDLPVAQKILEHEVLAEVCYGSSNYVCKRRLNEILKKGEFGAEMVDAIEPFTRWEARSETGVVLDYDGFVSPSFIQKVTRDPDQCRGRKCPYYDLSHYYRAKEKWKNANLLIVNHSLLCSHIALDSKLLPEFHALVIDESHRFPEIFLKSFELTFGLQELSALFRTLRFPKTEALETFIRYISGEHLLFSGQRKRITLPLTATNVNPLLGDLDLLSEEVTEKLELLSNGDPDGEVSEETIRMTIQKRRLAEIRTILESFLAPDPTGVVLWLSRFDQETRINYFFHRAPARTGEMIRELLLERLPSVVMTSATLTTTGNFDYFRREIGSGSGSGADETKKLLELKLDSPFDYKKRVLFYLPEAMPDPVKTESEFLIRAADEIERLVTLSDGGAFVLFTSIKSLNQVHTLLAERSLSQPLISQTVHGPTGALSRFLQQERSVLLGLATFWQGIDIPGDELRLVIIVKIPFRVPDDPVLESRMELEKKEGRNPFLTLQLPGAIIQIKQGFGRLIRSARDRGVVAILDPRMRTRSYGREILKSIPVTQSLQADELPAAYRSLFLPGSDEFAENKRV